MWSSPTPSSPTRLRASSRTTSHPLREDGLGWAAIAYGLQFRMEDFEDAIKAQGRVAMGLTKVDGKPEAIGK
jgi:hypothetical protein